MLAAALLVEVTAAQANAGYDCLLEAAQVLEIRSPVDGVIASIHVQRGESIRKGQVLVELAAGPERQAVEAARYRATMEGQIAAARNRLDYAAKKFSRAADLLQDQFVSVQVRDEADAERRLAESELQAAIENRELAKIEYRRAVEQLALRTIASPFDGVVLDRMLNPGDLAESGAGRKGILKIAQVNPLRVDVVLPAVLFGQVRAGARAKVTPRGSPIAHAATVKLVDKMIDTASGTFVARLELPNSAHAIAGGARCIAEIDGVAAVRPGPPPKL